MSRYFLFGGPLFAKDRQARILARRDSQMQYLKACGEQSVPAQLERVADQAVLEREERRIDRITDKSIGLLQFIAVALAVISFGTNPKIFGNAVVLVPLIFASFLLLHNMVLRSSRSPAVCRDVSSDIAESMLISAWRGAKLTIAIWSLAISMIAAIVSFLIYQYRDSGLLLWLSQYIGVKF